MTWNEATSLDESLYSLDSFFPGTPKIVEVLAGGLTNKCWKITAVDGRSYVWRPVSLRSYQFGLSRIREKQLLESLRSCHFAPDPVLLNDKGLLVEWLEGSVGLLPLSDSEIIGTLFQIHSVDIHTKPIPLFSYTAKVDGYWHKLKPESKNKKYEAIYTQWREVPSIPKVESVLCHFDLGEQNIVRTDQGIKVIDWEYAGVGDPRMDLAMTIDLNKLDMPKAVANYCKLMQMDNLDDWLIGVNRWMPRNQMMAMLWFLLGYQFLQDEFYLNQAEQISAKLTK